MTAEAGTDMRAAGTPPFWHKPNTTGQFPCPRCAHTTFFFDMKFFVLGGWNGHRMLNDLYALCMPQMRWVKVSTTGDPPSPRTGHATLVVGSKLILFGLQSLHVPMLALFESARSHHHHHHRCASLSLSRCACVPHAGQAATTGWAT